MPATCRTGSFRAVAPTLSQSQYGVVHDILGMIRDRTRAQPIGRHGRSQAIGREVELPLEISVGVQILKCFPNQRFVCVLPLRHSEQRLYEKVFIGRVRNLLCRIAREQDRTSRCDGRKPGMDRAALGADRHG